MPDIVDLETNERFVVCRRLRWRAMYLDQQPEPGLPIIDDGFHWCTHSMNCLGPDGAVADRDSCRSDRRCFED